MNINQAFPAETDRGTAELFERQQRELHKYQARYVYAPFQDMICPQVPGGFIPAGVIHPIPAPKGKINVKLLPEGAQVLQVVSPSMGIPRPASQVRHKDPEIERLLREIAELRQAAMERGQEPPSVAIYLHEVAPIVGGVMSVYGREGAIEVTALFGMPENAFEKHRVNDMLFGPEGERPATAKAVRERMQQVVKRASSQKGDAGRILTGIASEILASVEQCERFCKEHVRQRHLEMDDPQNDAPKRYSRRDLRAIEFIGAVRREEYTQQAAEQQQQAMSAIPQMLEAMERREQQWAQTFAEMSKALTAQTEALKSISANQKK